MRYQIVVADDEPLECEALQKVLYEFLEDAQIVKACNGREAIAAARNIKADLVILDIEMPGMGGIDAARLIRQELPKCSVVFLTAYSEFSYARQAVELGAVDYLLKPCSDQNLQKVISRIITQIDAQKEKERMNQLSCKKIENLTQWLEEQVVLTVMGGYLRAERVQSQLDEMGILFESGAFAIMSSPDKVSTEQIKDYVSEYPWTDSMHIIAYEYDDCVYLFIANSKKINCCRQFEHRMKQLTKKVEQMFGYHLFCAVGDTFYSLNEAQKSYYQAQAAFVNCSESQMVCGTKDIMEHSYEHTDFESAISRYILEGNTEQAVKIMNMAMEGLCAQQLDYPSIVKKVDRRINHVIDYLQNATSMDYHTKVNLTERLCCLETIEDLKMASGAILRELDCSVNNSQRSRLSQIKLEIANYIEKNYCRDLFLQQVAHEMNYSDTYFSKLFKQCFNKNFITYLTESRIKAAKKLLHNPTVNIKEVCAQVGYHDSNYFTKVFRRATGKNPSEYRASVLSEITN